MMKSRRSVLFLDDDPAILDAARRILAARDYAVDTAENLTAARQLWSTRSYDVVVVDMIMPEINGHEAINELSKVLPDAKYVLSSSYYSVFSLNELATYSRIVAVADKPWTAPSLHLLIDSILEMPQAA